MKHLLKRNSMRAFRAAILIVGIIRFALSATGYPNEFVDRNFKREWQVVSLPEMSQLGPYVEVLFPAGRPDHHATWVSES